MDHISRHAIKGAARLQLRNSRFLGRNSRSTGQGQKILSRSWIRSSSFAEKDRHWVGLIRVHWKRWHV